MKKVLTTWKGVQDLLDIKGGAVINILAANVVGIWWYAMTNGKPIPDGIGTTFTALVGLYAAPKITNAFKAKHPTTEDGE